MVMGEPGMGWKLVTSELAFERSRSVSISQHLPVAVRIDPHHRADPDARAANEIGRFVAHLATLRRMSTSVAGMLERGAQPAVEAALVKDIGTAFEREIPETFRHLITTEPTLGEGAELSRAAGHDHPARAGFHHTRRHARDPARHDCTGAGTAMSEMRNDLLKTVDRIFDEHCSRQQRESAEAGAWPAALWQALEEVGLTAPRCRKRLAAPGWITTMRCWRCAAAPITRHRCRWRRPCLPDACSLLRGSRFRGALTVAPVRAGEQLALTQGAAGVTMSGRAQRVPWGNLCAHAVVAAELGGKGMVGLVATARAARGVEKNLAGEPRALLEFDATPLIAFCAAG